MAKRRRRGLVSARLAAALALALHALPAQAQTGLRLVFDFVKTSSEGAGEAEQTTRGQFTARLGETTLAIRNGDEESVYDFAARRIALLDHASRQRRELSLYAGVDLRAAEIENRRFVVEMMRSLMGEKRDLVEEEIDLGVVGRSPAKAKLKEQRRGSERVFLLNGRETASFSASDAALPPALVPALRRLLVYEARLHPLVVRALLEEPRLPQKLAFRWQPVTGGSSVSWTLRELAPDTLDAASLAPDYALVPLDAEGVAEIAFRVRTGRAGIAPSADAYRARAERLLGDGRAFEALLVSLEQQFAVGKPSSELLRRVSEATRGDARADTVLSVIQRGERDPKGALAQLASVDVRGLEGGHVLAILRANQRLTLRESGAAQEEFARALTVNPFLIGPLVDAGKIYAQGFQLGAARECWDAVRAIAPGHPALQEIDADDEALRREYPQFF